MSLCVYVGSGWVRLALLVLFRAPATLPSGAGPARLCIRFGSCRAERRPGSSVPRVQSAQKSLKRRYAGPGRDDALAILGPCSATLRIVEYLFNKNSVTVLNFQDGEKESHDEKFVRNGPKRVRTGNRKRSSSLGPEPVKLSRLADQEGSGKNHSRTRGRTPY